MRRSLRLTGSTIEENEEDTAEQMPNFINTKSPPKKEKSVKIMLSTSKSEEKAPPPKKSAKSSPKKAPAKKFKIDSDSEEDSEEEALPPKKITTRKTVSIKPETESEKSSEEEIFSVKESPVIIKTPSFSKKLTRKHDSDSEFWKTTSEDSVEILPAKKDRSIMKSDIRNADILDDSDSVYESPVKFFELQNKQELSRSSPTRKKQAKSYLEAEETSDDEEDFSQIVISYNHKKSESENEAKTSKEIEGPKCSSTSRKPCKKSQCKRPSARKSVCYKSSRRLTSSYYEEFSSSGTDEADHCYA